MWPILYVWLVLKVASCADELKSVTRTFDVGDTVTLTCPRQYKLGETASSSSLHWIRLVSGNTPEVLGASYTFDNHLLNKTPHFTTKQEQGTFVLEISASSLNDTGFYYCVKVNQLNMQFISVTFLKIEGSESVVSVSSPVNSVQVDSGHSVDLQCWLQTESLQCIEDHMVVWFKPGLDQSSPGLAYSQWNSSVQCDMSPEDHGPHKCFYTFSKNTSPSDAGTYHCAVAACGQIHFGNAVNVTVKAAENKCVTGQIVLILLNVALTICLIVIVSLLCFIKKKCVGQNTIGTVAVAECQTELRNDELMYCAPKFTKKKAVKPQSRMMKTEEQVYSDVRVSH